MKKILQFLSFVSLASFYPMTAFAALLCDLVGHGGPTHDKVVFSDLVTFIVCNINFAVIPLIFALAVVMFIWGVVRYVIYSSDEGKKEQGRMFMLWGIIGLTVMVTVWALAAVLANTFGVNVSIIPQVHSPPP